MMSQNHLICSSKNLLTFLFLNDITKLWHYQKQCQCYLTLCKKKHDMQKITDCIRSNSEKRDSDNFLMFQQYTSNGNNFWDFSYGRYENCWCQLFLEIFEKCIWWYMYLLFFVAAASKKIAGGAVLHFPI